MITVKKGKLGNYYIAFVDAGEDTKQLAHVFKAHKAKPQWKGGAFQYWFWWLGTTDEEIKKNYLKVVEPALRDLHKAQGVSPEDSNAAVEAMIDSLINGVVNAPTVNDGDNKLTGDVKEEIAKKLEEFKQTLVNIRDDEEFKKTILKVQRYRKSKGHSFSFMNSLLIMIQKPDATICNAKTSWMKFFNRTVNEDAEPIWIRKKDESKSFVDKKFIDKITNEFLKGEGAKSVKELTAGQKQRLSIEIRKRTSRYSSWIFYAVYDVSDTTLIAGKEDHIQDILKGIEDLPWFKEGEHDDNVRPIYAALENIADSMGIKVDLVGPDVLGTARGRSFGGKIELLYNEGNDVYTTKTFVHELAHELLHQQYIKSKNKDLEKFFVGKQEGRDVVERQAELTAWMVMSAYGFNTQTTSFNYAIMWGGDENNMVEVFDTIAGVANYLIYEISQRGASLSENIGNQSGRYDAMDVAKKIGVQDIFRKVLDKERKRETMVENFFRLAKIPKNNKRIL